MIPHYVYAKLSWVQNVKPQHIGLIKFSSNVVFVHLMTTQFPNWYYLYLHNLCALCDSVVQPQSQ